MEHPTARLGFVYAECKAIAAVVEKQAKGRSQTTFTGRGR